MASESPHCSRQRWPILWLFLLIADVAVAMHSQESYPACAVNHNPVYFCCKYGTTSELYTRYQRPNSSGLAEYDSYFEHGWQRKRQVNFPDAFYAPSSPVFVYTEPDSVCRLRRSVDQSSGALVDQLQCGPDTIIKDFMGGQLVINSSLPQSTQNSSIYWTSYTNPRNNNASFPVGALCTSIMDASTGKVNTSAKNECYTASAVPSFRFSTYVEPALLAHYVAYGTFFVMLMLWLPLRSWLGRRWGSSPDTLMAMMNRRPNLLPLHLQMSKDAGVGVLLYGGEGEEPYTYSGRTPMISHMSSATAELRAAVDSVEQTGYEDSSFGQFVLVYFMVLTAWLLPIMIVLLLDSNSQFSPALFDPTDVLILVFILFWLASGIWLSIIVANFSRLKNFFRVKLPLDRCTYVHLFNPERAEIVMPDRSGVTACIARLESIFTQGARQGYEQTLLVKTTEPDASGPGQRYVEFQHLRYIYDDHEERFIPGHVPLPDTYAQIRQHCVEGLHSQLVRRRMALVGHNSMEVPMPSIIHSIAQEAVCYFYLYGLMCYAVWYFTAYIDVAVVNMVIIVIVIGVNIVIKRRLLANVLQMTRSSGGVAVKRDGIWQTVRVNQLVPGDLVRVVENWDLPCDLVLLSGGNVLCDESSLTGESMPVQKFPIPTNSNEAYDPEDQSGKKHTLFAGCKTLSSGVQPQRHTLSNVDNRSSASDEILAIVQSTGAHTVRGQLIQSILYPSPVRFKYDEHLKACIIFLLVYGIVAACIAMHLLIENAGLSNHLRAFVYGIFMISAVLSPLIPVVFTVGQANAAKRLQRRGVFCLDPQRIALGGKVRVFAFDKTGTITKQGLDFRGCVPVGRHGSRGGMPAFMDEFSVLASSRFSLLMKFAMASCHTLGYMNDDTLVGNEVEIKMFQATQWQLFEQAVVEQQQGQHHDIVRSIVESPEGEYALEIIKRFEFDHHRMSMSVIVQDLHTQRRFVFTKGSYERMRDICTFGSMPSDYTVRSEQLARDGCYVLSMGAREIHPSVTDLEHQSRDYIERDMHFLGLIVFQNELKPDSAQAIATLQEGDIRVVMITGDNAMTGCYIARASGMIQPKTRVLLGEILSVNNTGGKALVWKDIDSLQVVSSKDVHAMVSSLTLERPELAVTGAAFNYLGKMGDLAKLLFHIRIFSRMTPVEKADCIAEMMAAGVVTGMCGDGGNDCGALRVAHVGVALSDAEASVVSPFTSRVKSISAVIDICREGRCSLATSFSNLKFLMMYGLIGCGLRFTMYSNAVFLSQWAFMFGDGLVLVGLSYALSLAKPLNELGHERPTSSLVGPTTLVSMLGHEVLHVGFLYLAVHLLMTEPWYCPFNPANVDLVKWWLLQDSHLGTTLFLVTAPQYITSALAFGFGARFRRPIWTNPFLMAYATTLMCILAFLAFSEPNVVTERFRIATSTNVIGLPSIPLPSSFLAKLAGVVVSDMITVLSFEGLVVAGPVRRMVRHRWHTDALALRL